MYTKTSESFNKKVQGLSRTFSAKLDFDNLSITDGIRKISVSGGSNATGALAIGVTVCACVEVEISGTVAVSDNQMFSLSFGLQLSENDFEFIPYGKYIVNSVEITEEKDTKITAYDLMFLAEKTYNSTLEYPTTSLKMIDEICSKIGVSRADEDLTAISIPDAPIGYTMREILGYLAGLYGKFAVIDREGKLQIKWYEQNGAVLDYDHIKEPKLGETNYSLDSISILNGETVVFSVGSGNGISCENPYMTSSVLNRIWSQLKGFSFTPAQIEVLIADPRLDVWDMITLQDAEFPCMELRLEYDGGVSASVTASAESTTEGNVGYRSPETIEKQRIKQDLFDLGKIVAEKATIADLEVTNSFISRVESTANEALDSVSNLSVGGRNIILNTRAFTGMIDVKSTVDGTYNGLTVRHLDTTALTSGYQSFGQYSNVVYPEYSEIYTLSFYAKGTGQIQTFFYGGSGYVKVKVVKTSGTYPTGAGYADGGCYHNVTSEWERHYVTYQCATSGNKEVGKHVLFRQHFGNNIYICGVKLEKGNKATDWTPAPEDAEASITEVKEQVTEVSTNLEGFKTTVSKTYTTKADFDALEVGGTNLIRRSAELQGAASNAWQWVSTEATYRTIEKVDGENYYKCTIERSGLTGYAHTQFGYWYRSATGPIVSTGETYTCSVWYYCDSSVTVDERFGLSVQQYNSSAVVTKSEMWVKVADIVYDKWTQISVTFTISSEDVQRLYLVFNLYRNGKVSFTKPKLERGNKATDWTPAPEDNLKNLTGRNLVLGTGESKSVGKIDNQAGNRTYTLSPLVTDDPKAFLLSLKYGGALCLSYDIDASEVSKYSTATSPTRIGVYYTFTIKNISTGATASWYGHHSGPNYFTDTNTFNPRNNYNSLASVTETVDAPGSYEGHYACYCVPSNSGTLTNFYANPDNYTVTVGAVNCDFWCKTSGATISNVKLEVGNVPTEWSAAPEDLEERVSKAEATLEVQAQKIEAKVDVDGVISAINLAKGEATINANKINLNGVVTANKHFQIDEEGSATAKNMNILNTLNIKPDVTDTFCEVLQATEAEFGSGLVMTDNFGFTSSIASGLFMLIFGEGLSGIKIPVPIKVLDTISADSTITAKNFNSNGSIYGKKDLLMLGNITAKNFERGTLEVVVSSATVYVTKEIPLSFTPTETTQCVLSLRTTGSPQPRYLNCWANYYKPNAEATPYLFACMSAGGSSASTVPAGTYYIDYIAANI